MVRVVEGGEVMIIELSTKGTRTSLTELLTGRCYIGTVPRHELRDPFQDALPCFQPVPLVRFGVIDRRPTMFPRDVWEALGYHKATVHGMHTGWNK